MTSHPCRLWTLARRAGALAFALACPATPAVAQPTAGGEGEEPASPAACAALASDAERLDCYDRFFRREEPAEEAGDDTTYEQGALLPRDARRPGQPARAGGSLLDSRWELAPDSKLGNFGFRAYQPIYLLPWFSTSDRNTAPSSPAPGSSALEPQPLDDVEVKFQISFKTKVWQGIFGRHGDLWLAYTQSSRWQLYNVEVSRPFRETNYEPEALLVFAGDLPVGAWRARLWSLGLNHQSNGRAEPLSRSWNRITATVGLERPGWTLSLRPWYRIPEDAGDDDNPDLEDYAGRGDLLLVRHIRNHELSLVARHSLRGGDRSHGAVQLDWAFPIRGNLRAHVQLFRGYGESLIDYNHLSTQIGLGLSLIEWY